MARTVRNGNRVSFVLDDEEEKIYQQVQAEAAANTDVSSLMTETRNQYNRIYQNANSDQYADRDARIGLQKDLYAYEANLRRLNALGYDMSDAISGVPEIQKAVSARTRLFTQFDDEADYNGWKKFGQMSDAEQAKAYDSLQKEAGFYALHGDTKKQSEIETDLKWLRRRGGNGVQASIRLQGYRDNHARIADAQKQMEALQRQIDDIENDDTFGAYHPEYSDLKKQRDELQKQIEAMQADVNRYVYGHAYQDEEGNDHWISLTQDEAYQLSLKPDFESVSANRDFNNPTQEQLQSYDSNYANNSARISDALTAGGYYDEEGNLHDITGAIVPTQTDESPVNDKLGIYLSAGEEGRTEAYNILSASNGNSQNTWANIVQEGDANGWGELTDTEIAIYYYLLNEVNQESAYKYLEDMTTELTYRETKKRADAINEADGLEKLAYNIAAIPASTFGGIPAFIEDAARIIQGKNVNPYSRAHAAQNSANAIISSTAQDINDATGNKTVLGHSLGDIYQDLMSLGNNVLGIATTGFAYPAIMLTNAASSEVRDLYERGASKEQIAAGAVLAGAAEYIFERFSIEHLFALGKSKSLKTFLKNAIYQAGFEFEEEAATELANIISDTIVMKSQSEWDLSIQEYMNNGASKSEATWKAVCEDAMRIWKAGVGGALSGLILGGGYSYGEYRAYNSDMLNQGQQIMDSGQYDAVKALALDMAQNAEYGKSGTKLGKYANKVDAKINQANELKDSDVMKDATRMAGKLYDRADTLRQQQNTADIQSALQDKGLGKREAKKAAEVIGAAIESGDFSSKEIQGLMSRQEVSDAVDEILSDEKSGINRRNANHNLAMLGYKLNDEGKVVPLTGEPEENASDEKETETIRNLEANKDAPVDLPDGISGKVNGIKYENGVLNASVTTESGETVSVPVEDVSMSREQEDLVAVSKQFGADAPAVYAAYQPGIGVAEYGAAMKLARDYGYTGVSMNYAESSDGLSALHPSQIKIAYESGAAAWTKKSEQTIRKQKKGTVFENRKPGKVSMKGGTVEGVNYKAVDVNGLTAQQKAAVRDITRLAQVTGINFVFYQSEKNSAGKYSGANGIYKGNTIFLDINAGATDSVTQAAILRTAAHEMTHFIERFNKTEYRAIQEFFLQNLEAYKGNTIDMLVAEKQARSKEPLSFQNAVSEIIADGCEMMLKDTKIMELLASEHESIARKISRWLKKWVEDLKTAFTGVEAVHKESRLMIQQAEKLQEMWDNALMQALRNRDQNIDTANSETDSLIPGKEGTVYAENGDPVAHSTEDGTVQLSTRTYEEEGREAFRAYLEKCVSSNRLTEAEMQEMIDGIEDIYQTCKNFKDKYAPFGAWSDAEVIRDTYGKPVFSVVTPNGEYKMNLDFSLVCKKRRTLDAVFNEMAKRGIIDDFELGQKSVVKINEIIRKYGLETACALCFVDAKRFRQASMADSFVNLYNELVESLVPEDQRGRIGSFNFAGNDRVSDVSGGIDTWSDSDLDFSHIDSVMEQYGKGTVEYKSAKYIKENAEARRLLHRGDFMSSKGFDAVKSQNRNILSLYNSKKGTGGPKAAFGDVQYMNEIIKKARFWTPKKAYAVGGVRIQSFSDYVPRMVFDYVQMVYDLAATKLPAHAYTKEALFAKQFGLTGIKINMSLIPAIAKDGIAPGLDKDGNYVWAGESFDFDTAKEIQNAEGYSENCGTICVGVSYAHIVKLLSDPDIRMVIPYHKSGLNPIVAHMNKISEFTDYTSLSTNPGGCQNTMDKNGKKVEKDFDFNSALRRTGDPNAAVKEYLAWCDKNEYTAKFNEFRWHENYYKLIEDFTLYDGNGQYVPQRAVKAVFPTDSSAFGSMKKLIEAGLQEDAIIEGKRDKSLSAIVDEIEQTLPKTEDEIPETEVVQADRDLESELADAGIKHSDRDSDGNALSTYQQKFFADSKARDKNGNLKLLFHGTTSGGFTVFDPKFSDDGISLFASDNINMSATYAGRTGNVVLPKGKPKILRWTERNTSSGNGQTGVYKVYFNLTNPLIIDGRGQNWDRVSLGEYDDVTFRVTQASGNSRYDSPVNVEITTNGRKRIATYESVQDMRSAIERVYGRSIASTLNHMTAKSVSSGDVNIEYNVHFDPETKREAATYTTRELAAQAKNDGYDGVILTNIMDSGKYGKRSDAERGSVYIAFSSEQVKSVDNKKPTRNPDIRYSERDTDSVSNRSLLANALESAVQNDIERKRLEEYRGKIDMLNAEEQKLSELRSEIRDLSFAKGTKDTKRIKSLQFEANQTANRINTIDRQLLRLEAAKPLQNVLQREKEMAYKRAEQKGKEALAAYRLKSEVKQSEIIRDYRETKSALRGQKSDTAVIEKEFIRIAKAYEKLDAKTTAKIGKDTKTIADLKAALKEESKKHRADQKTWETEFNRLLREYEAADRSIDKLHAKIERQKQVAEKRAYDRKRSAVREKIKNVVNDLNQYLLKGNKEKHVMIGMQKAVAEALDAINMDTVGAEERIAKLTQEMMKAKSQEKIQEIARKIANIQERGDNMKRRLESLKSAYAEIKGSDDLLIANAHDDVIDRKLESVIESVGDTSLRDMTLDQLEDVYDMYKMVLTNIRNANKAFKAAKSQDIAVLGNDVMMEVEAAGGKRQYRLAGTDRLSEFNWNNLNPVYAFERIGSKTFAELFNNVRSGEDTWAKDITEAKEFSDSMKKKYGYNKWNFDKQYHFKSSAGVDFSLTLDQIMSLYAYSKRKQADDHLEKGGFVYDSNVEVVEKKHGIPVKYKVNIATAHNISKEILSDITGILNEDQKSFADEMQSYLSTTMGEKGNEVSLEMYGIKLFKEKAYFPLKSAKQFLFEQNEIAEEVRVKNSGFTKDVKPHANNPIILTGFMDAWANHVNDMSMYHAFVLPLEDFNRVFNYNTPRAGSQNKNSVKEFIQNAYGPQAVNYVSQLLKDLNGGARRDPRESAGKALVGRFKKAAVFASASVVIQQPSAIGRALALINPKYFDFNPKLIQHKKLWAEVKKYAPVAIIKEMGYFDTDMGMSTVDYIKGDKSIMDKADEWLSKAPALADELTWCHIWTAVKRETLAKNKGMDIKSDEFLQKVGKRFTEVIVKTQVYDSVLSRSANMRSKNLYMNMITSFMAEQTTSFNMLQSAAWDLKRGYKGKAAQTFGSVMASVVLNALLVSLVYAARDDDEDETWMEKYFSSLATELVEGVNPITYIPIAKDIWSLLQGYDVERADMSLIATASDALAKLIKVASVDTSDMDDEALEEHGKQVTDAAWGLVDAVMSMAGIPVKNVRRDVMAAINTYKTVNNGLSNNKTSFWNEIAESVKKSTPVWIWLPDKKKGDKLYEAIVSGDKSYQARIESLYDSQNAIDSARVKALRDNDPRILEAATAAFNGDPGERVRIAREIIAEGRFSQDDVIRAINAEINKLERAANGESESEKSSPKLYDMNDYYDAIMIGDKATADDVKGYYLDERIAQGDSEEDALNSFESSFTSTIKSEYLDGNISRDKVMSILTTYGGSSESEAETSIKKWDFEDEYGYSWDQRDNAYRLGDITMDELVDYTVAIDGDAESAAKFLFDEQEIDAGTAADMLVTYSGMELDDAENKVAKWGFKNAYGYSYDDRREAYISGAISASDLKKYLMDLGGMTSDEADEKIAVYDWRKRNPGTILDDNDIAAYISPVEDIGFSIEESGVSPEAFAEYRDQAIKCKGVDSDGDGKIDSGSKKAQILLVINSLPISAEQKTALYFLNGWAASRLYEAPWY